MAPKAKCSMGGRNYALQRVGMEGEERRLLHHRAEATLPEMGWGAGGGDPD